ncbi:hypothetical protein EJB05_45465 [Eragrostis curvula]|uniref:Uncharacterized protein n=1 Tax=Eragrostis curvula TaxID=38414 RepID=A0A5J9TKA3_9POAL|nr:hypothetical protein EJB05_45465 [Eragrostis curvula]
MARMTLPPSPSPLVAVKRDPDAAEPGVHTPAPPPRKRRRVKGRQPVTPTQLPLSPFLTPQTVPSSASVSGPTPSPATATASVKTEPDVDAGAAAGAGGRPGHGTSIPTRGPRRRSPPPFGSTVAASEGPSTSSRARTGGATRPASSPRSSAAPESQALSRRPAACSCGVKPSSRSRFYLRTQKLFDVWMRKLIWFPTSPKKHLVKLELALFYLSQGNIDNAYNATRTLVAKDGLQTEPILNLIHGLISYDKWYSGLPKDMQVEEFDVYNESCTTSMASDGYEQSDLLDSSEVSIGVHDVSLPACSSESSINNEGIDRKMNRRPSFVYPKVESDTLNESMIDKDFRSIFLNNSDGPACGLDKSLLPLRLKLATGTSSDCFDSYWRYKSAPNAFYEDAEKCLRVALHSNPPVMAALLPLIQLLLLGDKMKVALNELEMICSISSTALPFRLRGRLLEYFDQNQVHTISSCYEESLRRDPACSYSIEKLITIHRKGDCKLLAAKAACASHMFGPEFPYVKAVGSYLAKQKAPDEISFVARNMQNSVKLLHTLEKLTS